MSEIAVLVYEQTGPFKETVHCAAFEQRIEQAIRSGFRLAGPVTTSPIGRDVILTATLERVADIAGTRVAVRGQCEDCGFDYNPGVKVEATAIIWRSHSIGLAFFCLGDSCGHRQLSAIDGQVSGGLQATDRLIITLSKKEIRE